MKHSQFSSISWSLAKCGCQLSAPATERTKHLCSSFNYMNKPRRDNYIYFSLLWPIYINHHSIVFPVLGDYMTSFDTVKCSLVRYFGTHAQSLFIISGGQVGMGRGEIASWGAESIEASYRKKVEEATMSRDLSLGFKSEDWSLALCPTSCEIWGKLAYLGELKGYLIEVSNQHPLVLNTWLLLLLHGPQLLHIKSRPFISWWQYRWGSTCSKPAKPKTLCREQKQHSVWTMSVFKKSKSKGEHLLGFDKHNTIINVTKTCGNSPNCTTSKTIPLIFTTQWLNSEGYWKKSPRKCSLAKGCFSLQTCLFLLHFSTGTIRIWAG